MSAWDDALKAIKAMDCRSKKSPNGDHKFFVMTGRCFYCGKHNPDENKFQRQEYKKRRTK